MDENGAYVQVTHLNVLTKSFRSVETSLRVRCSGPTMVLRLQMTGADWLWSKAAGRQAAGQMSGLL